MSRNTEYPIVKAPFLTSRILVFSDFNCPYCFTLNEWIYELGASQRVRWVGIEHKPELPLVGENLPQDSALLAKEVSDVMRRAPEVMVEKPQAWINSHQALLYQNALEDDEPELAPEIRRAIFRAYWHDDFVISKKEAILTILDRFNVTPPEVEPEYLMELSSWWKQNLDRIPCMIAPTGIAHLGLQDRISVSAYLNSALHQTKAGPGCL